MERFQPKKPSFFRRISSSPIYYLFLLLALAFGSYKGFLYLKTSDDIYLRSIAEKIASSRPPLNKSNDSTGSQSPEKKDPATANGAAMDSTPNPYLTSNTNPPASAETNPPPDASMAGAANPPTPPTEPGTETTAKSAEISSPSDEKNTVDLDRITGPLELEVFFFEVPTAAIQQFFAEAQEESKGSSGEMSYGIVKNGQRWFKQLAFKQLDKINKAIPGLKKKVLWYQGTTEPTTGAPYGFNFQVNLVERQGGRFSGDISLSRTIVDFGESGPLSSRKDFYLQFETQVGSTIGIAGILPGTPPKSEEKEWLQDSFLKIFLSPSYGSGETDLLVLMQFKGDSK